MACIYAVMRRPCVVCNTVCSCAFYRQNSPPSQSATLAHPMLPSGVPPGPLYPLPSPLPPPTPPLQLPSAALLMLLPGALQLPPLPSRPLLSLCCHLVSPPPPPPPSLPHPPPCASDAPACRLPGQACAYSYAAIPLSSAYAKLAWSNLTLSTIAKHTLHSWKLEATAGS